MEQIKYTSGESIEVQEQSVNATAIENMDNSVLANYIDEKLGYDFTKLILIKPLQIDKVYKTLTVPEDSGEKDENGDAIMQMTIKQVETESVLRKGIVISLPTSMSANDNKTAGKEIKPGDTVVYPNKRSIDFDLLKDSALVDPFDIIAVVK
jgi:co-chaperonin GroES (HSP10)